MASKPTPLSESELVSILMDEERQAVGYYANDVAADQDKALDYYYGEPFGDEREGHSTVVSRDVAEVIDWAIPSLMRMFVGNDEAVVYEPTDEHTTEAAELATGLANYQFYHENNGFDVVHDWLKDGLLQKLGVIKVYWDNTPETKKLTFEGISEEDLTILMQEDGAEPVAHTEYPGPMGMLHDVTLRVEQPGGTIGIDCVPPEEFLISRRSKSIAEADYLAHRTRKSISDLLQMGFDEADLASIGAGGESQDLDERENNRFEDEDYSDKGTNSQDPSRREVWLLEEYVKIDADGDGISELRKVSRVGKTILENMEIEEAAFVGFSPIGMPHKAIGMSLADQTMELQRVNSVVLRQALDNLYLSNNPRMEVPDAATNEDTLDDLLMNIPGGIIRTAGGGGMLNSVSVPFVAGNAFQMLEYLDGKKEQRTGVTRYNQGLDADTLNKTATGVSLIQEAGQDRLELIARRFANSMAQLFKKILKLNIDNATSTKNIRIKGKWQQVDPRTLDPGMNVSVQVGLGTGKKDQRLAYRRELIAMQEKGLQMGAVAPHHMYKSLEGFVKDMDLGDASEFFMTPDEIAGVPDKPDPKVTEIQQKHALELQKLQMEDARKREQMQREHQLKIEQMNREFILKERQMMLGQGGGSLNGDVRFGGEMG